MIPKEDINEHVWVLKRQKDVRWDESMGVRAGKISSIGEPYLEALPMPSFYEKYNPDAFRWYENIPVCEGIVMTFHDNVVLIFAEEGLPSDSLERLNDFIREYKLTVVLESDL